MSDIYTNTPENQKIFDEFWDTLEAERSTLPISCDQMIKKQIEHLDRFYTDKDVLNVTAVKELLMKCLRGC